MEDFSSAVFWEEYLDTASSIVQNPIPASSISDIQNAGLTESNKTTVRNAIVCVHSFLHQLTQHVSAPHGGHPQV
jgi:hypothetical protein